MAEIMRSIRLECVTSEHNKFYELVITIVGGIYVLNASYGKIGNNPQSQIKYSGKHLASANAEFDLLLKEKKKKGYKEVKTSKPFINLPVLPSTKTDYADAMVYGTVKVKSDQFETKNLAVKKTEDPPEKRDRFDNLE